MYPLEDRVSVGPRPLHTIALPGTVHGERSAAAPELRHATGLGGLLSMSGSPRCV